MVDHRAVADEAAETKVALDQRRQFGQRAAHVDRLGRQDIHLGIALGQGARPDRLGRADGSDRGRTAARPGLGVGAGQARAAEHQVDLAGQHIAGDAVPKQLHDRLGAVLAVDAGTAEFEHASREGGDLGRRRIRRQYRSDGSARSSRAHAGGRCRPRRRAPSPRARSITSRWSQTASKSSKSRAGAAISAVGCGAHLFVEDAIAQSPAPPRSRPGRRPA